MGSDGTAYCRFIRDRFALAAHMLAFWRKSLCTKRNLIVVDAKLGTKRTCPECEARFYDLNKSPIVCPKCSESFVVEPVLPSKHDRPGDSKPKEPKPAEAVSTAEDIDDDDAVAAENVDEVVAAEGIDLVDTDAVDASEDSDKFLEDEDEPSVEQIIPEAVKPHSPE